MGLLSAVTLIVDIFIMALILETALDVVRPERVMRTDHLSVQKARSHRLSFRICGAILIAVFCGLLWASWHFVFARLFR